MWPDGYDFQQQMFYCSRWTKSMEKTFVDALLEQARRGNFRVGLENRNAVQHALYEVNKKHDTKVVLPWALSRVQHLQERHKVFNWLVQRPDVICNCTLRFVTATDETWLEIARERKLAKCYVNAYEDLLEELNTLFCAANGRQ
ncbi:hypothetical protein Salat_0225600 [Sesamum alatum]|uniref:Myb/SANT-like domain-containing protein n=1 Tax=Sesamum alatum TaxID=300844 RepID=A0AAE1YYD4_9LAMI|nr:hypothetical protein Salat_0225600 [Sesamum alatum]